MIDHMHLAKKKEDLRKQQIGSTSRNFCRARADLISWYICSIHGYFTKRASRLIFMLNPLPQNRSLPTAK